MTMFKWSIGGDFGILTYSPRILIFCWVASLQKVLTMDQLRRKNFINVNGCLLCLNDEESVNHLLIHCNFAHKVWASIINMLT